MSHRTIEEHAYRLCPLKIWQNCQIKPIRNQIRISVHVLLNSGGHFTFLCLTCIIMMGVKSLQALAVLSRLGGSSWEERNGDGLRAIELKGMDYTRQTSCPFEEGTSTCSFDITQDTTGRNDNIGHVDLFLKNFWINWNICSNKNMPPPYLKLRKKEGLNSSHLVSWHYHIMSYIFPKSLLPDA